MSPSVVGVSSVARRRLEVHSRLEAQEPAMQMSEELAVLIRRAEAATATARRLLDENDLWRRRAERQLDYLFELGADLRRPTISRVPAAPPRPAAEDT